MTARTITQGWSSLDYARAALADGTLDDATQIEAAQQVESLLTDADEVFAAVCMRWLMQGKTA